MFGRMSYKEKGDERGRESKETQRNEILGRRIFA